MMLGECIAVQRPLWILAEDSYELSAASSRWLSTKPWGLNDSLRGDRCARCCVDTLPLDNNVHIHWLFCGQLSGSGQLLTAGSL